LTENEKKPRGDLVSGTDVQIPLSLLVRTGRWIEKIVALAGTLLANIASLATVIMILIGTADVIGTKIFNTPVPATYETTETLMVALVFGGLAYAQLRKRHIQVELLTRRLSPKTRLFLDLVGLLIGTAFFTMLTWRGAIYFWRSWLMRECEPSLIRFPIYPSKLILLVGAGLMTMQLLIDLYHTAARFLDRDSRNQGYGE